MRVAWGLAGSVCAFALALTAAPAGAGTFTVQLCQQRNRALDGLSIPDVSLVGGARVDQTCGISGTGVRLGATGTGLTAASRAVVTLRPADGGRITTAILWHDSTVASPGYSLQLTALTDTATVPMAAASGPGAELGGSDQEAIGPTASGFDFTAQPVNRIDYALVCSAVADCAADPGTAVRLYGARLTIDDPTAPVLDGIVAPPVLTGQPAIVVRARDTIGGLRAIRLFAGLTGVASATLPCDFRVARPCPATADTSLSWDTNSLADGTYALRAELTDAAGNVTAGGTQVRIDNRPPVSVVLPTLSSPRATVGVALAVSDGTWRDPVTAVADQWLRCATADVSSCAPIAGATDVTYTPTAEDRGDRLRVRVTASDAGGSTDATTIATLPVPFAPSVITPPHLLGDDLHPQVAMKLVIDPGTWAGADLKYSYAWSRCVFTCLPVALATGPSYIVTDTDRGADLRVVVTATDAGGRSTAADPVMTGTVRGDALRPVVAPTIAGDVTVGGELEATTGAWSEAAPHITWEWRRCTRSRCDTSIAGARRATYDVRAADVGHELAAIVTATAGGAQVAIRTGRVGPVRRVTPGVLPRPLVIFGDDLTGRAGGVVHTVDVIRIRRLRPGSHVEFTCRRGCSRRLHLRKDVAGDAVRLRLHRLQLRDHAAFDIAVTHRGRTGRVWRFTVAGVRVYPKLFCLTLDGRARSCGSS